MIDHYYYFHLILFLDIFGENLDPPVTFLSLKARTIELLLRALTVEADSANTQMLLGNPVISDIL